MNVKSLKKSPLHRKAFLVFIFACAGVVIQTITWAESGNNVRVPIGWFSIGLLDGWKSKQFSGETHYEIQQEGDDRFLRANSAGSASALYMEKSVDLQKTPYLNWRWRVDQPLPKLKEHNKEGDDYAARVYVVIRTGKLPWSVRALNYVWSSYQPARSIWPNAFTKKATMISVRNNGTDPSSIWLQEKISVLEDIQTHLGINNPNVVGVAIMTDSDNSQGKAQASYGDIYFSSE